MQDAVPTLAVLAAFNENPVRFTGIANLRVKECDRIAALAQGLNRIAPGLAREEGDELVVTGDPTLAGKAVDASIDTFADHRIAMSFALAGLKIAGVGIENPDCVAKTYPGYWDALASLGRGDGAAGVSANVIARSAATKQPSGRRQLCFRPLGCFAEGNARRFPGPAVTAAAPDVPRHRPHPLSRNVPRPARPVACGRRARRGLWALNAHDIREHGLGRHRAVDDTPAGGGPGMVLRADVIAASLDATIAADDARPKLLMSPRGRPFTQSDARAWASGPGLVLLCARFEGVDERVIEGRGFREVSIGDYVLSGGELAALVVLDACVRLLPGVMGKEASGHEESFSDGLLEYPQYTKPREWEGRAIPDVLLSGDHARIRAWRRAEAERLTRERRPDLPGAQEK